MAHNIKGFEVSGYFGFHQQARNITPEVALRELIQNAVEARAHTVEVRLTQRGIQVFDDGVGMTAAELGKNFSRFHETGKRLGTTANFGVGAKLAFLVLGDRMVVTSRKRGKPANCIELGTSPGGPSETDGRTHGVIIQPDGKLVRPADLAERWSTEVWVNYPDFDEEQVLKAINGRFETPASNITVVSSAGTGRSTRRAVGFLSCLERSCTEVKRHELSSCILTWGRRVSHADAAVEEEWEAPPLAFSFEGEVFSTKKGDRASRWLDGAGIPVGHKAIHVLVTPRGNDLTWNTTRTGVNGVDLEAIQLEIAQALKSGELKDLALFIEWFEAAHTSAQDCLQTLVQAGLDNISQIMGGLPLAPGRPPGPTTPDEPGTRRGPSEPRGPRSPSQPGTGQQRKRGFPTAIPADETFTGGCAVLYSASQHRLYVWLDHPLFKPFLDRARPQQKRKFQALLFVELVTGFTLVRANLDVVGQNELDIIAANVILLKLAAHGGTSFKIGAIIEGR